MAVVRWVNEILLPPPAPADGGGKERDTSRADEKNQPESKPAAVLFWRGSIGSL